MTIEEFLKADHEGHLAHSAAELRRYADHSNNLSLKQRQEYFSGITTVFPLMLLSHYYEWLTGKESADYMEHFVPTVRSVLQPQTDAMLDTLYHDQGQSQLWSMLLHSYLATVPYIALNAFARYALTQEQIERTEKFTFIELTEVLPQLAKQLADCESDPRKRINAVLYLGGDYPFELLGRFHHAVISLEQ